MQWLWQNGFMLLQSASIVASLLFTAFTIRSDAREKRIENLFRLTSAHREIWNMLYDRPHLKRVLEQDLPAGSASTPTLEERLFVRSLILHLAASFRARTYGLYFHEYALSTDIRQFFTKPIPRAIWEAVRQYQEPNFIQFIDGKLS